MTTSGDTTSKSAHRLKPNTKTKKAHNEIRKSADKKKSFHEKVRKEEGRKNKKLTKNIKFPKTKKYFFRKVPRGNGLW